MAYGLNKKGEKNVLVFDLGGGTFDVTILTIDNDVFEVLSTNGDTHLGGEDFDHRLMEHFIKIFAKKTGKGTILRQNNKALQKLRREVEKAKRTLSNQHSARIEIEGFVDGEDFSETLTRAKFEELNMDLFRSTLRPVEKALKDSNLRKNEIDEVVLVGGSTRIPKIQALLKDYFNGKEPSRGVNPDEAVAHGAAIQAGIISGETTEATILDVNPLTLGIETVGGVMSKLISRNSVIPTKKTQVFSTAADNQQTVTIQVYEGERPMTKDNHLLGRFDLTGIPIAPRGVPQIEVTFELDVNSILHVSAKEVKSGKEESITITNDHNRLSTDQIDQMIKDAEKFAEEDDEMSKRMEAYNQLESLTYGWKNQLLNPSTENSKQLAAQLSQDDKDTLTDVIEGTTSWLEANKNADFDQIKAEREKLESIAQPILNKLRQRQGDPSDSNQSTDETKSEL